MRTVGRTRRRINCRTWKGAKCLKSCAVHFNSLSPRGFCNWCLRRKIIVIKRWLKVRGLLYFRFAHMCLVSLNRPASSLLRALLQAWTIAQGIKRKTTTVKKCLYCKETRYTEKVFTGKARFLVTKCVKGETLLKTNAKCGCLKGWKMLFKKNPWNLAGMGGIIRFCIKKQPIQGEIYTQIIFKMSNAVRKKCGNVT